MLSDGWHVGAFGEKQALYDLIATYRELVHHTPCFPAAMTLLDVLAVGGI
jgi:hypothetical protein